MVEIDGRRARDIRKRLGITQVGLAALVRVQQPYISKVELGKVDAVSAVVFRRWQKALQVSDPKLLMPNGHGGTA